MQDCVKVMIVVMLFVPELNCIIASCTVLTKFTFTAYRQATLLVTRGAANMRA